MMVGVRSVSVCCAGLALVGGVVYALWSVLHSRTRRTQRRLKHTEKKEQTTQSVPLQTAAQPELQVSGTQVLVLGLEGSGKTSLLHSIATEGLEQEVRPTEGFNAVSINREKLHIEFLEIGGAEKLRVYWGRYLKKARLLVFVVDSADTERLPVARSHLHQLLSEDPYLPLVILANKQDLPGARGVAELYEDLGLGSIGDAHKLCVVGTQVQRGGGSSPSVQDARELIVEMMNNKRP